jgi:ribose 5-phosphate isomerase B
MASASDIRDLVRRVVDEIAPETEAARRETTRSIGIAIGADHGGFHLKERLVTHLRDQGFAVVDCGTSGPDAVDYPDFAHAVARQVADGSCECGIVIDGAGIGSSMTANKVPGVRAALCYDISSARNSREHNHANVLTLGAGLIGESLARQIVDTWLATEWGPGRHAGRVEKITEVERRYALRAEE